MVRLEYKSLVTKEIIDYYLSKIKDDEKQKKDLISTVSKFDIMISTKPIIEEEEEKFYYKIWIWRRDTKKRAHIKLSCTFCSRVNPSRFVTISNTIPFGLQKY